MSKVEERSGESKTILAINECDFGSTGSIARNVLDYCIDKHYKCFFAVHRSTIQSNNLFKIYISKANAFFNRIFCRIDGSDGFHNKQATKKLINFAEKHKIQLVFLHNVHGRYINLELLFAWCKKQNVPVVWTLHDCWAFTGRCAHFENCNCYKWKDGCGKCPSRKEYPAAYLVDGSSKYLFKKAKIINDLNGLLTIVCPSQWLHNYLKESKINNINSLVINNGINLTERPSEDRLDAIRKKYDLSNKKVFMFASLGYSVRKGLEYINRLADELPKDKYAFLVVGIEEKHKNKCSPNAINVGKLGSRKEMDEFFSVSDAFVNPTLEENFPTVNLESLCNGTPVITFNTGGSPEMLDKNCGIVVEKGNYEKLKDALIQFNKDHFDSRFCIEKSLNYSKKNMSEQYYQLFNKILGVKIQ